MAKLSLSDFKRSNMLLIVIVAVAVLMFVFIPEFLGLASKGASITKSLSFQLPTLPQSRITEDAGIVNNVEEGINQRLQNQLEGRAPLSQLEYLIDQGYIDYLVETRIEDQKKSANNNDNPDAKSVKSASEFIPRDEITWSHIHSSASLKILEDVKKKSGEVLVLVDKGYPQSKAALTSYISAVNRVISDSASFTSSKEAIELVDSLDRKVTTTLAEERVPRKISADWAQISTASVIGSNRADRLKQTLLPEYNPDPIIVHVVMSRANNGSGPSAEAQVGVKFIVNGDEFKEATLERVSFVESIQLNKGRVRRYEDQTFPELRLDWLKPDLYTLVVKNTRGEEYKKTYDFRVPKYNPRTWLLDQRSGTYYYKLPYGRPNSPQLFEARFASVGNDSDSKDNLFDTSETEEGLGVISTF